MRGAAVLIVVPGVAAAWALWPLSTPRGVSATDAIRVIEPPAMTLAALDADAFRAPIWVAASAPPAPPAPPPPLPALRLQLLAVVQEEGVYRAVLYDPDADKVL